MAWTIGMVCDTCGAKITLILRDPRSMTMGLVIEALRKKGNLRQGAAPRCGACGEIPYFWFTGSAEAAEDQDDEVSEDG